MRVAVVTGASSGIGAELCKELKTRGFLVVGLSRRPAPNADEHEECDVSDRAAVDAAAAAVLARHPSIDLLVNNAGMPGRVGFLRAEPDLVEAVMKTNYLGSVWTLRAFLPGLHEGAQVVNVVSVAGTVADGPYSAAKHAQLAFSRATAFELGRRGIRVLTVNPGYVETPGFPQREKLGFLARRVVVDPPFVVARIIDAIERDKREIFVPRWYRAAAWLQALFPGGVARLRSRSSVGGRGSESSRSDSQARR